MSSSGLRRSLLAALTFSLITATGASAATVEPLLDTSVVERLHQMVPLGPAGDRIAINGDSRERGRQVGANSFLTRNGIYFAAADGSGLRRVWGAEEGEGLRSLTATGDGSQITYVTEGLGSELFVMDTATERAARVRGGTVGWDTQLVAGQDRLFAVYGDATRLRRISASSHTFLRVRKAGGAGTKVWREHFAVSGSGAQIGSCGLVQRRGKAVGLQLGALDTTAEVLNVTRAGIAARRLVDEPVCAVSDGGTTTAAVDRRTLYARRDGAIVKVRLPAGLTSAVSVSPSGRFVVAGGGSFPDQRSTMIERKLAIVDLETRRVAAVEHLGRYVRRTSGSRALPTGIQGPIAWSPDETRVALTPTSGGVMLVDTASAAVRFVRSPAAPVGFRFWSRYARVTGFSADGSQLIFTLDDYSDDVTVDHPYAVGVAAGSPRYLLSSSLRSFSQIVRSADGNRTWLLPSSTCHSVYPQTLLRLAGGALWDGPFEATENPFA